MIGLRRAGNVVAGDWVLAWRSKSAGPEFEMVTGVVFDQLGVEATKVIITTENGRGDWFENDLIVVAED